MQSADHPLMMNSFNPQPEAQSTIVKPHTIQMEDYGNQNSQAGSAQFKHTEDFQRKIVQDYVHKSPRKVIRKRAQNEEEFVVVDDDESEGIVASQVLIPPLPEGGQPRIDPARAKNPTSNKSLRLSPTSPKFSQRKRRQFSSTFSHQHSSNTGIQSGLHALSAMFPKLGYEDLTRLASLLQLVAASPQTANASMWGHMLANQQELNDQSAARKRWCDHEEAALQAGVAKYGVGKWKAIKRDPMLGPHLERRNNVHLKDKWRNMILSLEKSKDEDLPYSRSQASTSGVDGGNKEKENQLSQGIEGSAKSVNLQDLQIELQQETNEVFAS